MSFPYKNVLLIGATSGLGLALAERMIDNGIFVIAVGRRKDRLDEFVAKHGTAKVAASQFDITDLKGIPAWVKGTLQAHPNIDAVVLNSGIQRTLDWTRPGEIDLEVVQQEITTNYTAYVSLAAHLLPHLQSLGARPRGQQLPAALVAVSSGLAIVPIPRCGNYCATKAALHSLCWTMREQLARDPASAHVRVIEILPPAVQTELHSQQRDLVEKGQSSIGITIEEFTDDCWEGLTGGLDEILVGPVKQRAAFEEGKRKAFAAISEQLMKSGGA